MRSRNKITVKKVPISVIIDILLEMEEKNIAFTDITVFTGVKDDASLDINDRLMFFVPDRDEYFNEAPPEFYDNDNEEEEPFNPDDLI